jgi:hypothetical protein
MRLLAPSELDSRQVQGSVGIMSNHRQALENELMLRMRELHHDLCACGVDAASYWLTAQDGRTSRFRCTKTWRHDVRRGGYPLQVPAALANSRRRVNFGFGSVISSGWEKPWWPGPRASGWQSSQGDLKGKEGGTRLP